jgi:hypothetical protein
MRSMLLVFLFTFSLLIAREYHVGAENGDFEGGMAEWR